MIQIINKPHQFNMQENQMKLSTGDKVAISALSSQKYADERQTKLLSDPTIVKTAALSSSLLQQNNISGAAQKTEITLRTDTPPPPQAIELEKYFKLAGELKKLTALQKQKIFNECLAEYKKSVAALEDVVSELAAKHPDAKEFAHKMINRIFRVIKAYYELEVGRQSDLSEFVKELKIKLGPYMEVAATETCTGTVGFNPLSIEKAVKEGTLREQMLLINMSIWGYPLGTLARIFYSPETVSLINDKLKNDFQINVDSLNKFREKAWQKKETDPFKIFFSYHESINKLREAGHRIFDPNRPKEPPPMIKDIEDITLREARAALGDYISEQEFTAMKAGKPEGKKLGERRVQWVRGKDIYRISEEADFYKKAVALGGLRVVTGPSGTTNGFLQAADFLNMQDMKNKALLALIGWMVPAGDHSLHEIRTAGEWFGIDYPEGPKAFENIYPDDPNFQNALQTELAKKGYKLPGYYLRRDFQLDAANKLGFLSNSNLK